MALGCMALGLGFGHSGGSTELTENQKEKTIDNEMEAWLI